MTIDQITDHAQAIKDRIPSHLDGAVNLQKLFDIIGPRFQELETQLFNLLNNRHLTVAAGVQLDGIGQILDLVRLVGQSDIDYRAALIARSGELAKSGEMESLIGAFYNFTNATHVDASEYYPAGVLLVASNDADPESVVIDQAVIDNMELVKAAGVELTMQVAEINAFTLSDASEADANNNGPTDADHGLGDEILTEGGSLSRAI